MASINPNVLFQGGFSKPAEIKAKELDLYVKSFDELTSQVRSEIAETKSTESSSIDVDRIMLSTMVRQGDDGPERLILENCGNMRGVLTACKEKEATIDEKTLARLNALLNAALDDRLQVVYKEKDIMEDTGHKQELMILSHYSSNDAPELRTLRAMFGESSTITSTEFSNTYKGKLQTLEGLWVNPITQDVELSGSRSEKIEGAAVGGLKDNPNGSADDEGADQRFDDNEDLTIRARNKDDAIRRIREEEERKDKQADKRAREDEYQASQQKGELDAKSQRAHGNEPTQPSTD